jgi:transcriptional regulator with XRE-family HTH domain
MKKKFSTVAGSETIGSRIKWLLAQKSYSQNSFARESGLAVSAVNSVINGRNNPDFKFIQALLRQMPEVNRDWIILGEGDPFSKVNNVFDSAAQAVEEQAVVYNRSVGNMLDEELLWMRQQIHALTNRLNQLQKA